MAPLESAPAAKCPALFVVGKGDKFIPPEHTQKLYEVGWGW